MATETERRLAEARTQLVDLKDALAVATGANPDDPNAPDVIDLHDKIEAQEKLIKRLEGSVLAGKDIAKKKAHEQRAQTRNINLASSVELANSRIHVAKALSDAISKIGPILAKWEAIGEACADAAAEAQRYPNMADWHHQALGLARGKNELFESALIYELFEIGFGVKGIYTSFGSELRRPLGTEPMGLEEAARYAAEQLGPLLKERNRLAHEKDFLQ